MKLNGWTVLSLILLVLGVAFYLWMGLSFGRWTDRGVYAVTIVLVAFGLAGTLVSMTEPRPA